ncbi:MAG: methylmalonyl-CoA mutase family protein [Bryobacteraceae bacterium]|jgi:methylmalonyl-CoA mutase
MPEDLPGAEILHLGQDFPPVPTAVWEAAIAKDLKGADYEKKLVWRTDEGLALRPYYRAENLAGLEAQTQSAPGQFPFARGSGKAFECADAAPSGVNVIRADELAEAGGNAVQQLGYALAAGVERLAALAQAGTVDHAARSIEFVFAVGSTYFLEIAKLRAARLVWAQAVAAFQPADLNCALARIHVRTTRLNKSVYDHYTNLLRVTTEALAAAVGGCDRLTVEPFGFDKHLAVNVGRILEHEAHVDAVADPAGGSYYIETLTDSLARAAWKLFQRVEAAGGYSQAVESGAIARALAESRARLEKAVASRHRTLVGVNNYPDLNEKTADASAPAESNAAFPAFRLAEAFEKIRRRTERHAAKTGRVPNVLLLKRGDLKMRVARANFSRNFFGCAGFGVTEAEELAAAADLIVLCSSDAEYLALAQEVCPAARVPVIVAGNPKEQIDALKGVGVAGFIHMQSDAVQTLTEWQKRLGMEE